MKEIILDTNIFVRLLVKDEIQQYEKARLEIGKIEEKRQKGLVSILVVNEIIWVLENHYQLTRADFIPQLLTLLLLNNIEIIETSKNMIISILQSMKTTNIDFADYYLNSIKGQNDIFSFDKDFKKIKAHN